MICRENCGACCIEPSIITGFEGMQNGKPAGTKCIHLTTDYKCKLFNSLNRPQFCRDFTAEELVCGNNRDEAINILRNLENKCQ